MYRKFNSDVSAGNIKLAINNEFFQQYWNFFFCIGRLASLFDDVIPCSSVPGWHHLKFRLVCADFSLCCVNLLIRLLSQRTFYDKILQNQIMTNVIDSCIDLMPWFGMGSFSWSSPGKNLWCAVLLFLCFGQLFSADVQLCWLLTKLSLKKLSPQTLGTNHDILKILFFFF